MMFLLSYLVVEKYLAGTPLFIAGITRTIVKKSSADHKEKVKWSSVTSGSFSIVCICVCVCETERERGRERREGG